VGRVAEIELVPLQLLERRLGVLKVRRLDPAAPAALVEIEIASLRGMVRPA
jgi:hypothetical protein